MPPLSLTRSAPITRPTLGRPQAARRTASNPNRASRIFSGLHLDDGSTYYGGDHDARYHDDNDGSGQSEYSEEVIEKDNEDATAAGEDKVETVQMGIPAERDVESGDLEKAKTTRSARSARPAKDPNLVTWDGPEDPENPKNWTKRRKWAAAIVVSSFTFISPVSSSMVAPALSSISREFGITSEVESQLVLSIFVLAYAFGPLILGPLSEIYGRVPVLQLANLVYLVFNIACGVSRTKGEMIAFRFLSGLGGSAPLAIGGGVLSDCWRADERGRAISIYSLAPLLGPAVGPIAGGFITQYTTWRWAFYATSIADAVIQISGLLFLRETYPPKLLHNKAKKLRKETGNSSLHTEFEHPERSFVSTMERSLIRPFKLLATQPIVQVLALYMAYLYGLMYLVLSTFPVLWDLRYHESIGIGGLNYISLGFGFTFATQVTAPVNDTIYRRLKIRNENVGKPEFRVPLMIPGSFLVPAGLFLYGWSAQYHTHWILPNIGAAIFAAGVIIAYLCIQTYLIDSYTRFAASAIAAAAFLRSIAGFGFPLFAPYMYNALDYGWGNSVIGFIAFGVGVPAPLLLWKYGERLRKRSKFAAGGGD